jgi:olfactory receptor
VMTRTSRTVLKKRMRMKWESLLIKKCIYTNLSVSRLSCDNITFNWLYQFVVGWTLLGSDFILILSYSFILRVVLRIKAEGAVAKALSTCGHSSF